MNSKEAGSARDTSLQVSARIVRLLVAPLLHEFFEFVIDVFRQHDTDSGEQIAGVAFRLEPLALEAEGAPGIGPGRDSQFHRAVERGNAHLPAKRRFVKRDRQLKPQIGTVRLEQRMRRDVDRDQRIACSAGCARPALTLQPDLLPARNARRNL